MRKRIMFKKLVFLYLYFYLSSKFKESTSILSWIETQLVLFPVGKRYYDIEENLKDKIEEISLSTIDGVEIYAWCVKAQPNMPTILYCHGQGENVTRWQNVIMFLIEKGYGVMMPEYRGHYKSQGSPSEIGLYRDASAALYYLELQQQVKRSDIIVWGRSLGGAVAADIASRNGFKGVILESTFNNITDIVKYTCSSVFDSIKPEALSKDFKKRINKVEFIDKYDNCEKLSRITSPTLIIHSVNDQKIPCEYAQKLAESNTDAEFYLSEKGDHDHSEWAFDKIDEFMSSLPEVAEKPPDANLVDVECSEIDKPAEPEISDSASDESANKDETPVFPNLSDETPEEIVQKIESALREDLKSRADVETTDILTQIVEQIHEIHPDDNSVEQAEEIQNKESED